jgi:DNA-binding HxlR family transcriptional regulator
MKTARKTAEKTTPDHSGCTGDSTCPISDLLARIGDKWSMLVIVALAKADNNCLRFSELMRDVNGISQRMLSTTLRHFERDGIVTRRLYPEVPPRVEYTLTKRGTNLLTPVKALVDWLLSEWPEIEKSRQSYDAQNKKS